VLYCFSTGCILLDEKIDMFLPFHAVVHHAVSVV
jgi:hypothetical protein